MAFQLSPGVLVVEKDLTNVVPAVATSIGGYVGEFAWGPVLDAVTISSELELVKTFGKPNDTTAASFFSAANYLSYSNNLKVVRAVLPQAQLCLSRMKMNGMAVMLTDKPPLVNLLPNTQEHLAIQSKYPCAIVLCSTKH